MTLERTGFQGPVVKIVLYFQGWKWICPPPHTPYIPIRSHAALLTFPTSISFLRFFLVENVQKSLPWIQTYTTYYHIVLYRLKHVLGQQQRQRVVYFIIAAACGTHLDQFVPSAEHVAFPRKMIASESTCSAQGASLLDMLRITHTVYAITCKILLFVYIWYI